ncbi:hypothetical protein B0H15DRAFT_895926 [Mycena belliarum]|uniref:MYND-type domain-containing protein n=1 Tax=Mycena belliarum TaxID=1033014 RepID=A0AAD6TN84_9AGAR|nr:hypothetical protein B0H15DRAFT_895926 [Mycena belliae]
MPPTECASCGIPASMRCVGCMDAPEYKRGDAPSIAYCGVKCQNSHWSVHKGRCAVLRKRTRLLRVAKILRAALLTYREVLFDIPLARIELREGVLYLYRHPSKKISLRPFPGHLTTSVEHKEAALTHNQCTLAQSLLGPLARKLLAGVASPIETLDLHIGKPLVPTVLVEAHNNQNSGGGPHTMLKVGVHSSGETWIVDPAGCQYGFRDVLIPYDRYFEEKACTIVSPPKAYLAHETTDLEFMDKFFANQPLMRMGSMAALNDGHRKGRTVFATFVDKRVGSGKDFFDSFKSFNGSAAEFEAKLKGFVGELKKHLETKAVA